MKRLWKLLIFFLAYTSFAFGSSFAETPAPTPPGKKPWENLAISPFYKGQDGLSLYQFKGENGSDVNLLVVDLNKEKWGLMPFFNEDTNTTTNAARGNGAKAAVNGGFFNLSDGFSTSYVTIDGKSMCEPRINRALTTNPKLTAYLDQIFNRSELRILEDKKGKQSYVICNHNDAPPPGLKLRHALQAGPRLLPESTEKEEAFVRKDPQGNTVDSIGCYRQAARTAIGITPDNFALIICVAGKGQSEFSSGLTLAQLAALFKKLGCTQALNFDGGTSTTMVVKVNKTSAEKNVEGNNEYTKVCGGTTEKLVKSGLLVGKYKAFAQNPTVKEIVKSAKRFGKESIGQFDE